MSATKRPPWRRVTDIPETLLHDIEAKALALATSGESRIGVKHLVEVARHEAKVAVNNTLAPSVADHLVQKFPHLNRLIERRARGQGRPRHSPQTERPPSALLAAAAALEAAGATRVVGVVFETVEEGETLFLGEAVAIDLATCLERGHA